MKSVQIQIRDKIKFSDSDPQYWAQMLTSKQINFNSWYRDVNATSIRTGMMFFKLYIFPAFSHHTLCGIFTQHTWQLLN
jgi:hypothetical protein